MLVRIFSPSFLLRAIGAINRFPRETTARGFHFSRTLWEAFGRRLSPGKGNFQAYTWKRFFLLEKRELRWKYFHSL